MANQTGQNIIVSYIPEVTFNVPVTGGGGYQFRVNAGGGLNLARALIQSNEISAIGMKQMPRLGSRSVTGNYAGDLSLGTFDPLLEAIMRGTWSSTLVVTEVTASLASVTVTAHTIVASAGSWITAGLMVGDIIRATNFTDVGNNNRDLRISGLTADTITVIETLIPNAVADTAFTITRGKKLVQGITRRSFTFDEYNLDLDLSKQIAGCRISSLKITGAPDGMCVIDFGIVGATLNPLATGASPSLTSPILTSSIGLTWADARVRLGTGDRATLTAFDLTMDMGAKGLPVIGSSTTPDVFEDNTATSGSFTSTLQDFSDLTAFASETEAEFQAILVEPGAEPAGYMGIYLPRIKYTGFTEQIGQAGAKLVTLPFTAGPKGNAITGYDNTAVMFTSSAA